MRTPLEVLAAMLEMFESGDASQAPHVIAGDYLDHQGLDGSPLHGPGGFAEVVEVVQSAFPELRISVLGHVSTEHHIAAVLEWTYSSEADLKTRQTLEWLTVSGGRAIEHRGASIHPH